MNKILNEVKARSSPDDEFYTPARTVKMIMDPLLTYCKHHGCVDDYLFVMCADDDASEFVIYAKEYKLNYVCFLDFLKWRDHIPPNNNKHIIIVTNPPFSLLSKWEVPHDVDYVLIAPTTALAYNNLASANLTNFLCRLPGKFKNGKSVGVVLISTIQLDLPRVPKKVNWANCHLLNSNTLIAPLSWALWFNDGKLIKLDGRALRSMATAHLVGRCIPSRYICPVWM